MFNVILSHITECLLCHMHVYLQILGFASSASSAGSANSASFANSANSASSTGSANSASSASSAGSASSASSASSANSAGCASSGLGCVESRRAAYGNGNYLYSGGLWQNVADNSSNCFCLIFVQLNTHPVCL